MIKAHQRGFPAVMDKRTAAAYVMDMKELLRTNDPTVIAFASALLQAEDIPFFEFDVNMSVLEGSIGVLPRRLMVRSQDRHRAALVLRDNGIDVFEGESWL